MQRDKELAKELRESEMASREKIAELQKRAEESEAQVTNTLNIYIKTGRCID